MGVELGYFYQFGIFAYIMTAIRHQSQKQKVKEHLKRVSNILQYLSFEFLEKMLIEMKTLRLERLENEFLTLTQFH